MEHHREARGIEPRAWAIGKSDPPSHEGAAQC
jgi:hypothetical protein